MANLSDLLQEYRISVLEGGSTKSNEEVIKEYVKAAMVASCLLGKKIGLEYDVDWAWQEAMAEAWDNLVKAYV